MKNFILTFFVCLCAFSDLFGEGSLENIQRIAMQLINCEAHEIHIQKLDGGVSNDNYKVSSATKTLFFRLANSKNALLWSCLEREWQVTHTMSEAFIAPKVIFYSPEELILVTDFIEARHSQIDIHDPATLKRFCAMLSTLHSLPVSFPMEYDPFANIDDYVKTAREIEVDLPCAFESRILPAIKGLQAAGRESYVKTPAHLDLHAGNVLEDKNQLWLIDWEYAAMADPYFDLATLTSTENFSDHDMSVLLRYYLERDPIEKEKQHLYEMRFLADARWALWCYIQAKISSKELDYAEYGHQYLLHCLERIDFIAERSLK